MSTPDQAGSALPARRRTFEDKTVRLLAAHAGKIYLLLLALTVVVVTLREPLA